MRKLKYVQLFENFKNNLPTVSEINDKLQNPILIGTGGNARVYELSDKYVIRIRKGVKEYKINDIISVKDTLPNINYGQVVAKTDNNGITILKKQSGKPLYQIGNTSEKNGVATTLKEYKTMIKTLSNLPQETFDTFIEESKLLQSAGLKIDPSKSNNFLLDLKNKRINIVDVDPGTIDLTFRSFFVPLVSTIFINENNLRGDEELKKYWGKINDKLKTSCKRYNIKIDSEKTEYIFSKTDQEDITTKSIDIHDEDGW